MMAVTMIADCEYCYSYDEEDCRLVELKFRYIGKTLWHPPLLACPDCRKCLRGHFRYYRGSTLKEGGDEPPTGT